MPTFQEAVIAKMEAQIGGLFGMVTTKDIQIQLLAEELAAARSMIEQLGGELPPSQITIVNGSQVENQDTRDSRARDEIGKARTSRRAKSGIPSPHVVASGSGPATT